MKETIIAYIAGIIDGEGSILLNNRSSKKSTHRHPRITVANTSYELLLFLKSNLGGSICKKKVYKSHHKQSWCWSLGSNVIKILELILPYLTITEKIYRAKLIINEYKSVTPRNGKYTNDLLLKKLDFENRFFHPSTS